MVIKGFKFDGTINIPTLIYCIGAVGAIYTFESNQSGAITKNKGDIVRMNEIQAFITSDLKDAANDRRRMAETLARVTAVLDTHVESPKLHN